MLIQNISNKYNLNLTGQKRFNECKFKRKLPFDFYQEKNKILIEYDGEQHFLKNNHYNLKKEGNFEELITKDLIKTKYAINNGFHFLRIAYTDKENIEKILIYFLLKVKYSDYNQVVMFSNPSLYMKTYSLIR